METASRPFFTFEYLEQFYSGFLSINFSKPVSVNSFKQASKSVDLHPPILHLFDYFLASANPAYSSPYPQFKPTWEQYSRLTHDDCKHMKDFFNSQPNINYHNIFHENPLNTHINLGSATDSTLPPLPAVTNIDPTAYLDQFLATLGNPTQFATHLRSTLLLSELTKCFDSTSRVWSPSNEEFIRLVPILSHILHRVLLHFNIVCDHYDVSQCGSLDFRQLMHRFVTWNKSQTSIFVSALGPVSNLPYYQNNDEVQFINSILPTLLNKSCMKNGSSPTSLPRGDFMSILMDDFPTTTALPLALTFPTTFENVDPSSFTQHYSTLINSPTQTKVPIESIPFSIFVYLALLETTMNQCWTFLVDCLRRTGIECWRQGLFSLIPTYLNASSGLPSDIIPIVLNMISQMLIGDSMDALDALIDKVDLLHHLNFILHANVTFPISPHHPETSLKHRASFTVLYYMTKLVNYVLSTFNDTMEDKEEGSIHDLFRSAHLGAMYSFVTFGGHLLHINCALLWSLQFSQCHKMSIFTGKDRFDCSTFDNQIGFLQRRHDELYLKSYQQPLFTPFTSSVQDGNPFTSSILRNENIPMSKLPGFSDFQELFFFGLRFIRYVTLLIDDSTLFVHISGDSEECTLTAGEIRECKRNGEDIEAARNAKSVMFPFQQLVVKVFTPDLFAMLFQLSNVLIDSSQRHILFDIFTSLYNQPSTRAIPNISNCFFYLEHVKASSHHFPLDSSPTSLMTASTASDILTGTTFLPFLNHQLSSRFYNVTTPPHEHYLSEFKHHFTLARVISNFQTNQIEKDHYKFVENLSRSIGVRHIPSLGVPVAFPIQFNRVNYQSNSPLPQMMAALHAFILTAHLWTVPTGDLWFINPLVFAIPYVAIQHNFSRTIFHSLVLSHQDEGSKTTLNMVVQYLELFHVFLCKQIAITPVIEVPLINNNDNNHNNGESGPQAITDRSKESKNQHLPRGCAGFVNPEISNTGIDQSIIVSADAPFRAIAQQNNPSYRHQHIPLALLKPLYHVYIELLSSTIMGASFAIVKDLTFKPLNSISITTQIGTISQSAQASRVNQKLDDSYQLHLNSLNSSLNRSWLTACFDPAIVPPKNAPTPTFPMQSIAPTLKSTDQPTAPIQPAATSAKATTTTTGKVLVRYKLLPKDPHLNPLSNASVKNEPHYLQEQVDTGKISLATEWASALVQHGIELFIDLLLTESTYDIINGIDFSDSKQPIAREYLRVTIPEDAKDYGDETKWVTNHPSSLKLSDTFPLYTTYSPPPTHPQISTIITNNCNSMHQPAAPSCAPMTFGFPPQDSQIGYQSPTRGHLPFFYNQSKTDQDMLYEAFSYHNLFDQTALDFSVKDYCVENRAKLLNEFSLVYNRPVSDPQSHHSLLDSINARPTSFSHPLYTANAQKQYLHHIRTHNAHAVSSNHPQLPISPLLNALKCQVTAPLSLSQPQPHSLYTAHHEVNLAAFYHHINYTFPTTIHHIMSTKCPQHFPTPHANPAISQRVLDTSQSLPALLLSQTEPMVCQNLAHFHKAFDVANLGILVGDGELLGGQLPDKLRASVSRLPITASNNAANDDKNAVEHSKLSHLASLPFSERVDALVEMNPFQFDYFIQGDDFKVFRAINLARLAFGLHTPTASELKNMFDLKRIQQTCVTDNTKYLLSPSSTSPPPNLHSSRPFNHYDIFPSTFNLPARFQIYMTKFLNESAVYYQQYPAKFDCCATERIGWPVHTKLRLHLDPLSHNLLCYYRAAEEKQIANQINHGGMDSDEEVSLQWVRYQPKAPPLADVFCVFPSLFLNTRPELARLCGIILGDADEFLNSPDLMQIVSQNAAFQEVVKIVSRIAEGEMFSDDEAWDEDDDEN